MRHAKPEDLAGREPLLDAIRSRAGVVERAAGHFYVKSNGVLHFHADPAGLFADVKVDGDWVRVAVDERGGEKRLLRLLDRAVS